MNWIFALIQEEGIIPATTKTTATDCKLTKLELTRCSQRNNIPYQVDFSIQAIEAVYPLKLIVIGECSEGNILLP